MLPTYSLTSSSNHAPHPVCCQPTALQVRPTMPLTLYVANLQPFKFVQPCPSRCMLPTYSLTSSSNHAPHAVCCQPTALQVRPTMPLTLYVANLQPYKFVQPCSSRCMLLTYSLTSSSNHAPHAACCQLTALQVRPTMPLTLHVANLQPYKFVQPCPSRCMLPTYSPSSWSNHAPHAACCQPTALQVRPTMPLTLYVANLQPYKVAQPCPSRCMLPTYSPTRLPNHAPHAVCCQPTALQVRPTMPLTLHVANLQPYKFVQPCPSRCMLPTYSPTSSSNHAPHAGCCQPTALQVRPTMPLTLYVANPQPYKFVQPCPSRCMLPTYSPTSSSNHAPHAVCCQPTALQGCPTMPLTLYVANLQPYKFVQPCPSRCMLPTYSLTSSSNHAPHAACCQPTALQVRPTMPLTLYVANLQPYKFVQPCPSRCMLPTYSLTSSSNHAPHAVCCQPTALQVRPTMPLTLYVANLQPYKFVQPCPSRCMLPTYSLTSSSNHAPHAACCQPTALQVRPAMPLTLYVANPQPYKFVQPCPSRCMLPTYSLTSSSNHAPHAVCCQPTALQVQPAKSLLEDPVSPNSPQI